jgi:hypothetical protein
MPENPKPFPETINFDYLKSSQFRIVHADGAFISLSQTGLNISFFTERQPIPRRIVHKVGPDGTIGEEIVEARIVRDAVIRDTEISVMMTKDATSRLVDTLKDILKKYDELLAQAKQGQG